MILIAFDLSYTGASGWVIWNSLLDDPVIAYGEIKPHVSKRQNNDTVLVTYGLYQELQITIARAIKEYSVEYIGYEFTDWHRTLTYGGRSGSLETEYKIERQAQRTLGRAEAALIIAACNYDIRPYGIGANEAKKEFGAMRKDACAHLFAEEYPRFRFIDTATDDAPAYLYDTRNGDCTVSNHISDSFVIAKVVAARLKLGEQIWANG